MQLKYDELVSKLSRFGLRFKCVTVFTEGAYTPEDAIWNYKDAMVHIPYIHDLVDNAPIMNHKNSLTSVFMQKVFGFRFPIVVFDYEATPYTQTAVSTLFFFAMVIHNVCEEVRPGITRVTTNYHIGACAPFHWFIPLIGWILKRNYKVLTATDIPLRERRGQMRSWGYDFVVSDYFTPENIQNNNIIFPSQMTGPAAATLQVDQIKDGESQLFGPKSDHFGLKISRGQNTLNIHPRMCSHEGAELDSEKCQNGQMICPWHGRAIRALAKFDLTKRELQTARTPHYELTLKEGSLRITPLPHLKPSVPATPSASLCRETESALSPG